jgi:isopenicillin N synthase-like dioxygenase
MKDRPYLLMKAMSYLPQENSGNRSRDFKSGVTAHCDWSWLTFLIQDQVGGLEAQDRDGVWHSVDPVLGSIVVNTGELLEIESGGLICASPHRVINSRIDKQRYSVPIFVNPALDAEIIPAGIFAVTVDPNSQQTKTASETGNALSSSVASKNQKSENILSHVHKVIKPGSSLRPFIFGTSEWNRKAQCRWCYNAACLEAI